MGLDVDCILRRDYAAADVVRRHPPRGLNERKRRVHERACPPSRPPQGILEVTRWEAGDLPATTALAAAPIDVVPGWFDYAPGADPDTEEWHVNFASPIAFFTYPIAAFAQDEMQVLEHPALMSVHEALVAERCVPHTVVDDVLPTPVLVRGVERRCAIDTAPDPARGRPRGLYGNEFQAADPAAILAATRVLDPPTRSNILAIEAPACGDGRYSAAEIGFILRTAWAGFAAARRASAAAGRERVVVHTGYWGCGAYGGNRVLMTLLQAVAARAAGIDRLVVHVGQDGDGATAGLAASRRLAPPDAAELDVRGFVRAVHGMGLEWGVGNGT